MGCVTGSRRDGDRERRSERGEGQVRERETGEKEMSQGDRWRSKGDERWSEVRRQVEERRVREEEVRERRAGRSLSVCLSVCYSFSCSPIHHPAPQGLLHLLLVDWSKG